MYKALKSVVRTIFPNRLFFNLEPILRNIHYTLFYRGNKFQCTVCEKPLKAFVPYLHYEKICPNCGSLARDRRLWQIVKKDYINFTPKILDFSPSRSLYRKFNAFRKFRKVEYITTDLSGNFIADKHYDITNIDAAGETFELIICYHILEHIEEDELAMKELFRILKPNGTCIIQTPFKAGDIYEDDTITKPEDRLTHFGQEDHVRVYSTNGLKTRLHSAGFEVKILNYREEEDNIHGFSVNETILICRKGAKTF